jgi:hypothetical protein
VAAPFTGPFAPLFAACSAINIAIGSFITEAIARQNFITETMAEVKKLEQAGKAAEKQAQVLQEAADSLTEAEAALAETESQQTQVLSASQPAPSSRVYAIAAAVAVPVLAGIVALIVWR